MFRITLLLVDDHRLFLDAWGSMLNSDNRFEVTGASAQPDHALELARELRPAVILCDINMIPTDGIELTKKFRLLSPASKIIGVSMYNIPAYAQKMMQAGASGYVSKNSAAEELKTAILEVMAGRKFICEEIKEKLILSAMEPGPGDGTERLTKKEIDVIHAIKEGLSSREIAVKLKVSLKTVEVHRYNILRKLGLKNAAALINFVNLRGI